MDKQQLWEAQAQSQGPAATHTRKSRGPAADGAKLRTQMGLRLDRILSWGKTDHHAGQGKGLDTGISCTGVQISTLLFTPCAILGKLLISLSLGFLACTKRG